MNILINMIVLILVGWIIFAAVLAVKLCLVNQSMFQNWYHRKFFFGYMFGGPIILLTTLIIVVVKDPVIKDSSAMIFEARYEITRKDNAGMILRSKLTGVDLVYTKKNKEGSFISDFNNRKVGDTILIYSYRPTILPSNVIVWANYKFKGVQTYRVFSDKPEVIEKVKSKN
ncbi:MAG: hypothetical protein LBS33_06220 [Streptococcaceae bacterium]|jgi:hypothetical protein|nr:hypothetical protein [Streptococcaceae bacterium]